jgi:hypothetical protein
VYNPAIFGIGPEPDTTNTGVPAAGFQLTRVTVYRPDIDRAGSLKLLTRPQR